MDAKIKLRTDFSAMFKIEQLLQICLAWSWMTRVDLLAALTVSIREALKNNNAFEIYVR